MTAANSFDLAQAAGDLVRRSTEAQGLPTHVEDRAPLRRIATVLSAGTQARAKGKAS